MKNTLLDPLSKHFNLINNPFKILDSRFSIQNVHLASKWQKSIEKVMKLFNSGSFEKSREVQSCVNFYQKYLSKIMLISLSIIICFSIS